MTDKPHQGNRISELREEVDEIIVVPGCDLEFPTEGSLPGILAHDVESHVAQHGEILRSIVHTVSGPIFLHDDITERVNDFETVLFGI